MSVLDQLRDLEREMVGRLRELEPLVREYEQLRAAAGRLGVKYEPRSDASDGNEQSPSRRRRATGRSTAGQRASASGDGAGGRAKRATRSSRAAGAAARRRPAAPAGQRQQQMLELVGEHPGITVAEVAERLAVDATGLYRVMRRLTEAGQVRKDGRRLYPTAQDRTAAPATTPGTTTPEGSADSEAAAGAAKSG
jgi:winged helix-turn-helix DNA-binding protein